MTFMWCHCNVDIHLSIYRQLVSIFIICLRVHSFIHWKKFLRLQSPFEATDSDFEREVSMSDSLMQWPRELATLISTWTCKWCNWGYLTNGNDQPHWQTDVNQQETFVIYSQKFRTDQSHKSHNASVPYPNMHLSHIPQCIIQNRNVHISVLNWALWDMGQVQCGICEIGLFFNCVTANSDWPC